MGRPVRAKGKEPVATQPILADTFKRNLHVTLDQSSLLIPSSNWTVSRDQCEELKNSFIGGLSRGS